MFFFYNINYIEAIAQVQRRVTKLLPSMENLSYKERLQKLKTTYPCIPSTKKGYDKSVHHSTWNILHESITVPHNTL